MSYGESMNGTQDLSNHMPESLLDITSQLMVTGYLMVLGFIILWKYWERNQTVTPQSKVVLVTGADTGFGHLLCLRLSQMGFKVFAGCLNASEAKFEDFNIEIVQMDVTNDSQVQEAFDKVNGWLSGNPDFKFHALVNNAGIIFPIAPLELCSMASFERLFNVNLFGTVRNCRKFLPLLRRDQGRIVNVASLAGELACPMLSAYCASKWALLGLSDALRYELAPFGVPVSTILPDLYKTELVTDKQRLYQALEREAQGMPFDTLTDYNQQGVGLETMKLFIETMQFMANSNLEPVLTSMVNAVIETEPKYRYYPICFLSSITLKLKSIFPWFLDRMVTVVTRQAAKTKQI